ncbi:MAG: hypothetical protein CVV08_20275 [Gammaproteobacteria bacterium HGW-Gammaproteobacteria-12]|nr:MAG: hypothetical protein CVV08_20275 [Gammaproteobacteria bacterium HGW-Gammaproteobacteria-12]
MARLSAFVCGLLFGLGLLLAGMADPAKVLAFLDLAGNWDPSLALVMVGWGIAGICPGPAVAILLTGHWQALLFAAAMLAGMLIFTALEGWRGR